MRSYLIIFILTSFIVFGIISCSEEDSGELSEFEQTYGIGPVTENLELSEDINPDLAEDGARLFQTYCTACHQLDASITGPALRNVTQNREPEFVMNYILNPVEMRQRHPEGQQLSERFPGVMNDSNLDREEARAILEYLRSEKDD